MTRTRITIRFPRTIWLDLVFAACLAGLFWFASGLTINIFREFF